MRKVKKNDDLRQKEAEQKNFLQLYPLYQKDSFKRDFAELENYKKTHPLPSKVNLDETRNRAFDQDRISYILQACNFLLSYYVSGKSPLKIQLHDPIEKELEEGITLLNVRRILTHIAEAIFNLSGTLRARYKDLLGPAPFTWVTFEHLGALMKGGNHRWRFFTFYQIDAETRRFASECLATETTIEAAIPAILDQDITCLKLLFSFIQRAENGGIRSGFKVKPVELLAIRALTRRIFDAENLAQLMKYADNKMVELDHREVLKTVKAQAQSNAHYCIAAGHDDHRFERKIDLRSKQGKHAALRRLEIIGELVTGKHLSSAIKNLDPSIDWSALVTVRDVIVHQDEGDNRHKVQELLDNLVLFQQVLGSNMQELFRRLNDLIRLRDQQLPKYNEDPHAFWQVVYDDEKNQLAQQKQRDELQKQGMIKSRTSQDNIEFICGLPMEDAARETWRGILEGRLEIPDRQELGELRRHFPSKKDDPARNKRCREIVDQALDTRTTSEEREEARKKAEAEATRKKAEKEAQLTGLTELRLLVVRWQEKRESRPFLTTLCRIKLAIEALENIKEFMANDPFIQANFNFATLAEWEFSAQSQEMVLNFFVRLNTCPEFNDALEYNAAQLLQHLERISDLPESEGHQFLDKEKNYETLRCLRNWTEHGNYLHDWEEYNPAQEDPSLLQSRQKVVGPMMTRLIFDLLPRLYEIKEQYTWHQDICLSSNNVSLWRSVNTSAQTSDQNRPCGPGYGF